MASPFPPSRDVGLGTSDIVTGVSGDLSAKALDWLFKGTLRMQIQEMTESCDRCSFLG